MRKLSRKGILSFDVVLDVWDRIEFVYKELMEARICLPPQNKDAYRKNSTQKLIVLISEIKNEAKEKKDFSKTKQESH